MKKNKIIFGVIVMFSILLGGGLIAQNRSEVATQLQVERRNKILSEIPDDQLIVVSKWGDGFVEGYDLTGKFYRIADAEALPVRQKVEEVFSSSIEYKTLSKKVEKSIPGRGVSNRNIDKKVSPNNNFMILENACYTADCPPSEQEYIDYIYDLRTGKRIDLLPFKNTSKPIRGWYVKPQYIKESIPRDILSGDFSLQLRGITAVGITGVIDEICGFKSGKYLWSYPIGFRACWPAGKVKYFSREGPMQKSDACNPRGGSGSGDDCSSNPYPASIILDGYCNRPGIHRSDIIYPFGATRINKADECPGETCGHRWPNLDAADGNAARESHDTIVSSYDGYVTGEIQYPNDDHSHLTWIEIESTTPDGQPFGHRYLHLSKFLVTVGQKVVRGQAIGIEGDRGAVGAYHIHEETYQYDANGKRIFFFPILDEYGGCIPKSGYTYTSINETEWRKGGVISPSLAQSIEIPVCSETKIRTTTTGGHFRTETYGGSADYLIEGLYRGREKMYEYRHAGGKFSFQITKSSENIGIFVFSKNNMDPLTGVLNTKTNSFNSELPAGTYYILVDTKGETGIEDGFADITFTGNSVASVQNDGNNTFISATKVQVGQVIKSSLGVNDVDYYRISHPGGKGKLIVSIKNESCEKNQKFKIVGYNTLGKKPIESVEISTGVNGSLVLPSTQSLNFLCKCKYIKIIGVNNTAPIQYTLTSSFVPMLNINPDNPVTVVNFVGSNDTSRINLKTRSSEFSVVGPDVVCPTEYTTFEANDGRQCHWYAVLNNDSPDGDEVVQDLGTWNRVGINEFTRPDISILAVSEGDCSFAEKTLSFSKRCTGNAHDEYNGAYELQYTTSCQTQTLSCLGATNTSYGSSCANPNRDVWSRIPLIGDGHAQIRLALDPNTRAELYGGYSGGNLTSVECLTTGQDYTSYSTFRNKSYTYAYLRMWNTVDPEGLVGVCVVDAYRNPIVSDSYYGGCGYVSNLYQVSATTSSIQLAWDEAPGATEYSVVLRNSSNTVVFSGATTSTTITITGLNAPAITYDCRVDVKVNGDYSGQPNRIIAKTSASYACASPATPIVSISGTTAAVNWSAVSGSIGYEVNLYPVYTGSFEVYNPALANTSSSTRTATFTNLTPNAEYRVVVKNKCNSTVTPISPASANRTFRMGTLCSQTLRVLNSGTRYLKLSKGLNTSGPIRWRPTGSNAVWKFAGIETASDAIVIEGLNPGTLYDFQYQPNCSCINFQPGWGATYQFRTLDSKPDMAVKIVAVNGNFGVKPGESKTYKVIYTNVGNDKTNPINSYAGWKPNNSRLWENGKLQTREALVISSIPELDPGASFETNLNITVSGQSVPYLVVQTDASGNVSDDWKSDLVTFVPSAVCASTSFAATSVVITDTCTHTATVNLTTANTVVWADGVQQTTKSFEVNGLYPFTLIASNGCQENSTVNITTLPIRPRTEVYVVNESPECDSPKLKVVIFPDTALVQYIWNTNSTINNLKPNTSGKYIVSVTDYLGCLYKDSLNINVIETLKGIKNPATLAIDARGGTAPYAYLWENGSTDSTIPGGAIDHTVTVTDDGGCKWQGIFRGIGPLALDTTTKHYRDSILFNDVEYVKRLVLYPNPTSQEFKLLLGPKDEGQIQIYDMAGVLHASHNVTSGENTIPTASLPNGMYIVKFFRTDSETVIFSRLVVVR